MPDFQSRCSPSADACDAPRRNRRPKGRDGTHCRRDCTACPSRAARSARAGAASSRPTGRRLETGGTGPKVRPVVACKGTTCQYGLIDTVAFSRTIHERFYKGWHDVRLPHKFKIAVGGCPNNCVKPDLNDLGVIGQRVPSHDLSKCRGCKVCQIEKACPIGASRLGESRLDWNEEMCNHCGRCVGKCPFGVVGEEKCGYAVYIGGRWGKRTAQGRMLAHVFTSEEEVLEVIERALTLFRDEGNAGERFSDTVSRLGFENVQNRLLGR